ncbi:uncharacterized protein METZ01_LOCUS178425 [marine metagenome]|uniref:Uncharacterized protein n=1 Tax=marine metagenome TaxID=408172 RepID=A0A382CIW6_9ZZZZ
MSPGPANPVAISASGSRQQLLASKPATAPVAAGNRLPDRLATCVTVLHQERGEPSTVNRRNERCGLHDSWLILDVCTFGAVGHVGVNHPAHSQQGLAHDQGASASGHPLNRERHRLGEGGQDQVAGIRRHRRWDLTATTH